MQTEVKEINPSKTKLFQVVLLGDNSVGKSALAYRWKRDNWNARLPSTIGFSYLSKTVSVLEKRCKVSLWDTAGQARFASLWPMHCRNADAIILCFDVRQELPPNIWFTHLKDLSLKEKTERILVGTCIDSKDRKVTRQEAEKFAEQMGASYHETSAKTGQGVNELFNCLIEKLLKNEELLLADWEIIPPAMSEDEGPYGFFLIPSQHFDSPQAFFAPDLRNNSSFVDIQNEKHHSQYATVKKM